MAQKKAKPASVTRKAAPAAAIEPPSSRQSTTAAVGGTDPNRLLREAAWSRMFGRIEAKNPFAR
jgi:hypothetical protein